MAELMIVELSKLKPGRIFYSGRLYVVEVIGSASKARPWDTPPGTTKGCLTLSRKSVLAQFYPVLEHAIVLPLLKRSDFLAERHPTAYGFETEKEARLAAQLDSDLVAGSGLSLQKMHRLAAWVLGDGANPYRIYHYRQSRFAEAEYATFCAKHKCVECAWPDEQTEHWKFLFDSNIELPQEPQGGAKRVKK